MKLRVMDITPSLILFGPQATWPAGQDLTELRETLIHEPCLSPIVLAIYELPELWRKLMPYSSDLSKVECPPSI